MCGLLMIVAGVLGLLVVLVAFIKGESTQGAKLLGGALALIVLGYLFFQMERKT